MQWNNRPNCFRKMSVTDNFVHTVACKVLKKKKTEVNLTVGRLSQCTRAGHACGLLQANLLWRERCKRLAFTERADPFTSNSKTMDILCGIKMTKRSLLKWQLQSPQTQNALWWRTPNPFELVHSVFFFQDNGGLLRLANTAWLCSRPHSH